MDFFFKLLGDTERAGLSRLRVLNGLALGIVLCRGMATKGFAAVGFVTTRVSSRVVDALMH